MVLGLELESVLEKLEPAHKRPRVGQGAVNQRSSRIGLGALRKEEEGSTFLGTRKASSHHPLARALESSEASPATTTITIILA